MPDDHLPRPEASPGAHPEPRPDHPAGSTAGPGAEAERLGETLDLLATVMASLSDRVDTQGQALDRLTKTAAETRQAAFQARSQTDLTPMIERMAEALEELVAAVLPVRGQVAVLRRDIAQEREYTTARLEAVLAQHTEQDAERLRRLTGRQSRCRAWLYALLPGLAFGLVLAGAVLGPRAITALDWRAGCALIGGEPVGGAFCEPPE